MLRQDFRRGGLALFALALLSLAFLGLHRGLWTPDEPREAEISREMALAPTVIPTLNGQQFIEKPPLYYWTVALAYRIAGEPSAPTARLVSVAAGLGTLLLVFLWAMRADSVTAGVAASLMLATSVQFAISTHWVLLDPLLMLFTTGAAWAAWELLAGRNDWGLRAALFGALVLALWTKGLIGPVLIGVGVTAYVCLQRRAAWRNLHPVRGMALLAGALALLAAAIWHEGGNAALWEWGWVNHVQRLTNPGKTGHRQPLLYYLWTLPYAVLPWLVPFIQALRPTTWRKLAVVTPHGSSPPHYGLPSGRDLFRFCGITSAAMLLVLSISATKRETYLLPVLPLVFLGLGIHVAGWWRAHRSEGTASPGIAWWLQTALLLAFLLAPPLLVCVWLKRADLPALADFAVAFACGALLLRASATGERARAGLWVIVCALFAMGSLLLLAPYAFNGMKDMVPFAAAVGRELAPGTPVYTTSMDETLEGIVPFATGRRLVAVDPTQLSTASSGALVPANASAATAAAPPEWILVQDNHDGRAATLPPAYALERSQSFGPGRDLTLWRRRAP